MRTRGLLAAAAVALLLGACYQEPVAVRTTERPPLTDLRSSIPTLGTHATPGPGATSTASPAASETPTGAPPSATATPIDLTPDTLPPSTAAPSVPVAIGSPSAGCVNGWAAPAPGSPEYQSALDMLSTQMGVEGPWTVSEMRYFKGPDVPWIIDPHYETVEYWYVRAALADDPSFRARWLLEKRTDLIKGISAVAPFESTGYESPDWTGFVGDGEPTAYLGLPGQWAGIPYDFVTGEGDSGQPGLPDEVVDCLSAS